MIREMKLSLETLPEARPFQIISLFLVNSTSKNLPGNQEIKKKRAHEKNELYNPTEKQLLSLQKSELKAPIKGFVPTPNTVQIFNPTLTLKIARHPTLKKQADTLHSTCSP